MLCAVADAQIRSAQRKALTLGSLLAHGSRVSPGRMGEGTFLEQPSHSSRPHTGQWVCYRANHTQLGDSGFVSTGLFPLSLNV